MFLALKKTALAFALVAAASGVAEAKSMRNACAALCEDLIVDGDEKAKEFCRTNGEGFITFGAILPSVAGYKIEKSASAPTTIRIWPQEPPKENKVFELKLDAGGRVTRIYVGEPAGLLSPIFRSVFDFGSREDQRCFPILKNSISLSALNIKKPNVELTDVDFSSCEALAENPAASLEQLDAIHDRSKAKYAQSLIPALRLKGHGEYYEKCRKYRFLNMPPSQKPTESAQKKTPSAT